MTSEHCRPILDYVTIFRHLAVESTLLYSLHPEPYGTATTATQLIVSTATHCYQFPLQTLISVPTANPDISYQCNLLLVVFPLQSTVISYQCNSLLSVTTATHCYQFPLQLTVISSNCNSLLSVPTATHCYQFPLQLTVISSNCNSLLSVTTATHCYQFQLQIVVISSHNNSLISSQIPVLRYFYNTVLIFPTHLSRTLL